MFCKPFQAEKACFNTLPDPLSGSNVVKKVAQLSVAAVTEFMNAAGVLSGAPCCIVDPVATVNNNDTAKVPVHGVMVEAVPVTVLVKRNPPDTES